MKRCKALFDYAGDYADDLSFKAGDIITVLSQETDDEGWWKGKINKETGVFPSNHVELIDNSTVKVCMLKNLVFL